MTHLVIAVIDKEVLDNKQSSFGSSSKQLTHNSQKFFLLTGLGNRQTVRMFSNPCLICGQNKQTKTSVYKQGIAYCFDLQS